MAKDLRYEVRIAGAARRDIAAALIWSRREFGEDAARRYGALLAQVLNDIAEDPERPGTRQRPELARGVLVYHVGLSGERARSALGAVRKPRHLVVFRRDSDVIEVIRVLHDARDIERHLDETHRAAT